MPRDLWDAAYSENWAPWDIGRPQPVWIRLTDTGEITPPVLDSGCGTGEQALLCAERGLEAHGIDISPAAIQAARDKAARRGLTATFEVGDVISLERLGRTFATIIDSGVFHVFDDHDRARYVTSLAATLRPGGVLHLLCFSEHEPGEEGPRRVTQAELRAAFGNGWTVDRIEAAEIAVRPYWADRPASAWLARVVRAD